MSLEISVSPPDSLLKFDPLQFLGIDHKSDPKPPATTQDSGAQKLEEMLNSMLPPR